MPKLRTYRKFKKHFEAETYNLSFISRKGRSYLA